MLPRILLTFLLVIALASALTSWFEASLVRTQLREHAEALFADQGESFDLNLEHEATRAGLLMRMILEGQFGEDPRSDLITAVRAPGDAERARTMLGRLRRASGMPFGGIVDVNSGEVAISLANRTALGDPGPEAARAVLRTPGLSQRVVPVTRGGVDAGYGVAHVLSIGHASDEPTLHVIGYPLDDARARDILARTGIDGVEIVVDGVVTASTMEGHGPQPLGDVTITRAVQSLPDGRILRYSVLGIDRAWDRPALVGLVADDPLATLGGQLTQTRTLMLLFLVVVGGLLALLAATVMARPLRALRDTAMAIAGGDLERTFEIDRGDEIGELATALERMRRALRAQLLVIRQQADALQDAARRIVGVQDAERQRIAGELHDGIQQQLVVLRMQVGVAGSQLAQDPDRIDEVTRSLGASIDQLLADLRATGQALFPSILVDRGLGGALFSLAGRIELPLVLDLDPEPVPRFDPVLEVNAYFLVSEAVTNALKHADATELTVRVRVEGANLRIAVEDDGLGFEAGAGAHGGLIHLRDRVNALGGTLQLVSEPGQGTAVTAVLPIGDPAVRADQGRREGSQLPAERSRVSARALEVEQDGSDPAVEVDLLGEPELAKDGVGVLLDRPFADRQLPGDRGVASS
jgi:signal transduction histidine kinase